jgi:peroxiredoxin
LKDNTETLAGYGRKFGPLKKPIRVLDSNCFPAIPIRSRQGFPILLPSRVKIKAQEILMARTESAMLPLGTSAPAFTLKNVVTNHELNIQDAAGPKGLLVMFICRHCPFVKHLEKSLAQLGHNYHGKGIGIVAISSNDAANYPDDSPASLAQQAKALGFNFPYLYDETQDVAHAYDATCTPDFFLFDNALKLVYRGQFDDSRPGNDIPITGKDLRAALDAVIAGKPVNPNQHPSIGCNIKWK